MKKNKNGLKPCPFCGEKEDIALRTRTDDSSILWGHVYSFVECLPCDAKTGRMYEVDSKRDGFKNSKEQAIFHWNMRDGKK